MNKLKNITGIVNDITAILFRLAVIFMLFASYDTMSSIADILLGLI